MLSGSNAAVDDRLSGLSDAALLDLVLAGLGRLGATALSGALDDETLRSSVVTLARCESAVHAEKLRRLAEVVERRAYAAAGERSAADWLGRATGATPGEARAQAKTAAAMQRLPQVAEKLAQGQITPGHAGVAARGLSELERQAQARRREAGGDMAAWGKAVEEEEATAAAFDGMVADAAPGTDRNELGRRIDRWTARRDPDILRDRERRALARRGHWWDDAPDGDGLYGYRGKATAAAKAQITAALEPLARKTSVDDDRTPAQRRADALATLCAQACDRGDLPAVAAQRPHVLMVTTPAAQAGDPSAEPAHVDGVGPVGSDTARLLACDAEITVIVKGPDGSIWDVGLAQGNPSTRQRKAVIARDRTCVGCGAPASRCQIHHIRWRSRNGPTVTSNLVLVCWSCHQGLHHLGWRVQGDPLTGFTITRPPATGAPPAGATPQANPPPNGRLL